LKLVQTRPYGGDEDHVAQAQRRFREAEIRVARQRELIRWLEAEGHTTVAYDARKLLIAWRQILDAARHRLQIERQARDRDQRSSS
jgi:hypothetical protein